MNIVRARTRGMLGALLTLAAIAAAVVLPAKDGGAQAAVNVISQSAENRFPDDVLFRIDAEAAGGIAQVELRYTILPDGVATRAPASCTPDEGTRVACNASLEGNDPPRVYLPPFTEVRYSWLITGAGGDITETPEATVVYEDTRFEWERTERGGLVVYTYGSTDGRALAAAGRVSLDRTIALLATEVGFPVKVVAYETRDDMQPALERRSESFSERIITLGVRVSSDTVLVLNDEGVESTLQHELAHVVTKQAGEGGLGFIPAWLDEGTAVLAQDEPGDGYESAFRAAVSDDSLLSLRSTSSSPGDPDEVDLFYGQSWAFVKYLADTYGETKYAELFAIFKRGATVDDALVGAFGKDLRTLENDWRETLGLAPRAPGESRNETTIEGTLTPFGVGGIATPAGVTPRPGTSDTPPPASDDGGGSDGAVIGVIAAAGVVAALGLAGGSVVLARRRRS